MKRYLSLLLVLVLALVLYGCNRDKEGTTTTAVTDPVDEVAPLLEIKPTEVNIEYGQEYDLMTGVSAKDNVDGDITDQVVVDAGNFNNKVPGTYEIKYSVEDSAGNKAEGTRKITVAERRSTIEIAGEQYPILYNPQMQPRNAGSFPFDLTKVSVFEEKYAIWLMEHNYQRFAAFWSVVAVVDADLTIVEVRDFLTNQYTEEGSSVGTDWCTGTPTGTNNQYCSVRGMLANLTIPEGGYVIVFINDGNNGPGSPREFGSRLLADERGRIGETIKLNNLPEENAFDPNNTYPIIRLAEENDGQQLPVVELFVDESVTDKFGQNLLEGVTVWDQQDDDLTAEVIKVFYLDSEDNEVEIEVKDIDHSITTRTYGIRYKATDSDGNEDTETRYFKFKERPVAHDTFAVIAGSQFEAEFNISDFSNFSEISRVIILTQKHYDSLVNLPVVNDILVVVTDANNEIKLIRFKDKQMFHPGEGTPEWLAFENEKGLLADIDVPGYGFVYIFPAKKNAEGVSPLEFGVKRFINESGNPDDEITTNPWSANVITMTFQKPGFENADAEITVNGNKFKAMYNYDFSNQIGYYPYVQIITRDQLAKFVENGAYHRIQYGLVVILDENLKVVMMRDPLGYEHHKAEDGSREVTGAEGSWSTGEMQQNLLPLVPENGYVIVFTNTSNNNEGGPRFFGLKNFVWSGLSNETITDGSWKSISNWDINPFAEDFVIELSIPKEAITPHVDINGNKFEIGLNFDFHDQIGFEKTAWVFEKEYLVNFDPSTVQYPNIGWCIIAVVDSDGKIIQILLHNKGTVLTYDDETEAIVASEWGIDPAKMQLGLADRIPENGYAVVFQHTSYGEASPRYFGYKHLIGAEFAEAGEFPGVDNMTVNPFAEDFRIKIVLPVE